MSTTLILSAFVLFSLTAMGRVAFIGDIDIFVVLYIFNMIAVAVYCKIYESRKENKVIIRIFTVYIVASLILMFVILFLPGDSYLEKYINQLNEMIKTK